MYHSETNPFDNVRKSKIRITDFYKFIRHMHECLVNIVYQYHLFSHISQSTEHVIVINLGVSKMRNNRTILFFIKTGK